MPRFFQQPGPTECGSLISTVHSHCQLLIAPPKPDRLARSVADLMAILKARERKRVAMRILNLGMDTQTPTGQADVHDVRRLAQFEREMMLERQREVIAKSQVGPANRRVENAK
jgi:DNA invertase Pin-like site-specific DNA recombinase